MVGKQRKQRTSDPAKEGRGKTANSHNINDAFDVYNDMLSEVLPAQGHAVERPLKRRRKQNRELEAKDERTITEERARDEEEEDMDIEFEDVPTDVHVKLPQTTYRSDEDESEEGSDVEWHPLDGVVDQQKPFGDLELTLTSRPESKQTATHRKKAIRGAEKNVRIEIHKVHILCLLSHASRRNGWCNDLEVHECLKRLLDKKMVHFLNPSPTLPQFGRTESLKRGLEMASLMWRKRYTIAARGLRRPLWADDVEDLDKYEPPLDGDTSYEKADFIRAATKLEGSRDLGTQLFCALLRTAGVDARLVFSLQPLSFSPGGPSMPKPLRPAEVTATPKSSRLSIPDTELPTPVLNARQRLGHPLAAGYLIPQVEALQSSTRPHKPKPKAIVESPYPVYWVEVLDEAHQKWLPVDSLVLDTVAKPRGFEPPAADHENNMLYVIAFEDDGSAKDVTRRYAKAYNAKTRKSRIESTSGGAKWWKSAMRVYAKAWPTDVDQIEEVELSAAEAREPMPKNIVDFKDHPIYALERHLKRNEVLVRPQEIGKVAASRDASAPGGKRMESVYRRRDVKIAKSADAWYRQGRDVRFGEQPIKIAPVKVKADQSDDENEQAGTNMYSIDQTELYKPPRCVDGKVPKNSFGNLDLFVPSMVPDGGVHISHDDAIHAAKILGIDFAPALVGFEFHGRHGTAVLKGVVVAEDNLDAMEAVIMGLRDAHAREEEERRTILSLKKWRHFLMSLRIKERVDRYHVEGEEEINVIDNGEEEDVGSDYGGGGFVPE